MLKSPKGELGMRCWGLWVCDTPALSGPLRRALADGWPLCVPVSRPGLSALGEAPCPIARHTLVTGCWGDLVTQSQGWVAGNVAVKAPRPARGTARVSPGCTSQLGHAAWVALVQAPRYPPGMFRRRAEWVNVGSPAAGCRMPERGRRSPQDRHVRVW